MRITHAFAGDDVASDDNDNRTSAKRAKTRDHGDWDWENWKWDYDEGKWVERNDEIPKNKLELLAHYLGKLSQEAGMTDDLEKKYRNHLSDLEKLTFARSLDWLEPLAEIRFIRARESNHPCCVVHECGKYFQQTGCYKVGSH